MLPAKSLWVCFPWITGCEYCHFHSSVFFGADFCDADQKFWFQVPKLNDPWQEDYVLIV